MISPAVLATKHFSVNSEHIISANLKLFKKAGLTMPGSPDTLSDEEKAFPTDLSNLTADQVMDKLNIFTGLFAYASVLESAAKVEVAAKERELEVLEAREYLMSDDTQVTTRKYVRDTSDEVIKCKEALLIAESKYTMLKALKEGYDKMTFVLSRQLSLQMDQRS
jgi:hypothetical protein